MVLLFAFLMLGTLALFSFIAAVVTIAAIAATISNNQHKEED